MRLAAQARGGFYAAAPEAVAAAAEFLRPPDDGAFCILDPCCGRGAAIAQFRDILRCPADRVFAIELDEGRAVEAKAALPGSKVVAPASFFSMRITPGCFCFAWVNSPFDDQTGGGGRVEYKFLQRATELLRPKGVMALVCPEHVSEGWDIRNYLRQWFTDLSMMPFLEEHRPFNEVVIFGVKREQPDKDYNCYSAGREIGRPDRIYQIPSGDGLRRFEKAGPTDTELSRALAVSPLQQRLKPPPEPPLPQPPLSLAMGHIALLLAAGHLDGIVRQDGEPPHVVRGVASKISYVSNVEENENQDGSTTTKTTVSERIVLTVRAVSQQGVIRTFTQE